MTIFLRWLLVALFFSSALTPLALAESGKPRAAKGKEHRESMREQWRERSDAESEVLRDLVRERRERQRGEGGGVAERRRWREPGRDGREISDAERQQLRQDIREANRRLRRERD